MQACCSFQSLDVADATPLLQALIVVIRDWLIIFAGLLLAPSVFGCMTLPPALQPVLVSFSAPAFSRAQDTQLTSGEVQAKITIDTAGNVTSAEIVSINPSSIEQAPVLKSIRRAKFRIQEPERWPGGLQDYLHTFEFEILQPLVSEAGYDN